MYHVFFKPPKKWQYSHVFFYHNFINFDTDQSWSIIQMFSTFPILIAISIYLNVISLSKSEYTTCLFCSSAHHETSVDAMLTLIFLVSMVNIYISICWLHICMYINNNFILNKAKKQCICTPIHIHEAREHSSPMSQNIYKNHNLLKNWLMWHC